MLQLKANPGKHLCERPRSVSFRRIYVGLNIEVSANLGKDLAFITDAPHPGRLALNSLSSARQRRLKLAVYFEIERKEKLEYQRRLLLCRAGGGGGRKAAGRQGGGSAGGEEPGGHRPNNQAR